MQKTYSCKKQGENVMKHIKAFLPNITISNHQKSWKFNVMNQWNTIMGSLSTKVSIYKIYNDSITLGVSDSSWMQELYLLSNIIKQKINNILDKPRIETIRFHFITNQINTKKIAQTPQCVAIKERPLTTREKKALEKINDPELSQALTRLLQKCHQ